MNARIINYHFVWAEMSIPDSFNMEADGKRKPSAGSRYYGAACFGMKFAEQWFGTTNEKKLLEALDALYDIEKNSLQQPDVSEMLAAAEIKGELAFVEATRSGHREGYYLPDNRPDGSIEALADCINHKKLQQEALNRMKEFLFGSCREPSYEDSDKVLQRKYPYLRYVDMLHAENDFVEEYHNQMSWNSGKMSTNAVWEQAIKEVLRCKNDSYGFIAQEIVKNAADYIYIHNEAFGAGFSDIKTIREDEVFFAYEVRQLTASEYGFWRKHQKASAEDMAPIIWQMYESYVAMKEALSK